MIKAKFKIGSVEQAAEQGVVKMHAAVDPANAEWARYTPAGQITMSVKNGSALDAMIAGVGKHVMVTFDVQPD